MTDGDAASTGWSFEALAALTGRPLAVATDVGPTPITLEAAETFAAGGSLTFTGDPAEQLEQGTYDVSGPTDADDPTVGPVFLVPLGPGRYQAVFG